MRKIFGIKELIKLNTKVIAHVNKRISLPSEEVFVYIYQKAKDGNEMAAVQIYEWATGGKPEDSLERQVYCRIVDACKELFV